MVGGYFRSYVQADRGHVMSNECPGVMIENGVLLRKVRACSSGWEIDLIGICCRHSFCT